MDRPGGQEARRRLLDAAVGLIAERGWARVTTRAVAQRAGLPHGAVSYHFPGKQVLLAEAALALVERSFPLEDLRAASGLAELVSLLRDWAGGRTPVDQVSRAVLMEAMREAARDATVRERLAGMLADYRLLLAELVRADHRRRRLPAGVEPAALATLLAAAGDGLLLHAMLDPRIDVAGAVDALIALLPDHGDGRDGDPAPAPTTGTPAPAAGRGEDP